MKKIAVIGAGLVAKPLIDYFIDQCQYKVFLLDMVISKAEKLISGRTLGTAVHWTNNDPEILDSVISQADIVVSLVPKPVHIHIAKSCLRNSKNMITTSYETPELLSLETEVKKKGLLILNELGEVPGLDHLGTQMLLDEIRKSNGRVKSINSYGSGLPAFESNNNPMGYKFSWDPRTVFVAAQTSAAYIKNGKRIEIPGDKLFEHFWLVNINGVGTFESYPNKDVQKYIRPFGLDENVSFYRGLLRYSGYCNNMKNIKALGLMENEKVNIFDETTYKDFTASLIGSNSTKMLEKKVCEYLKENQNADIVHRLKWLGLFDDSQIAVKKGTNLDILLDLMLKKMYYEPFEKDMIILHIEILAEYPNGEQKNHIATMVVKGIPNGDSAMSRAVALPAAISAKLILEGEIKATGLLIPPKLPELFKPVIEEMKNFGFKYNCKIETVS